ncbi:hypothetical protein CYLTODRAFT_262298 [Cylindrobasidium torrendii FP15055 ss-10]|uniref:Uncharacterized protein n=1 Tax=Cylindrobasidium torrendii FP15055 ss-10 TaxID=1314674 RepID=A0A0D7ASV0_9AGAR|nr:hypothetical protein CYLTODRAFT_262298 [Cylindrobasidium torrendii FP15055 ss-10]
MLASYSFPMAPTKRSAASAKDDREPKKPRIVQSTPSSPAASTVSSTSAGPPSSSPPVSHVSVTAGRTDTGAFAVSGWTAMGRLKEYGTRFGGLREVDGLPSVKLVDDWGYNGSVIECVVWLSAFLSLTLGLGACSARRYWPGVSILSPSSIRIGGGSRPMCLLMAASLAELRS